MHVRHKSCGIVGLPNVGKSTFFNALSRSSLAAASNFPFCTIEPNVALVPVPDQQLLKMAKKVNAQKIVPCTIKFVDIAGLIRGASAGAGLGNQFLASIREVDVILHVLRCYENAEIIHVESRVQPTNDREIVETELCLADLQRMEKRLENVEKRGGDPSKARLYRLVIEALNRGVHVADVQWTEEEKKEIDTLQLITNKPMAYICNIDETQQHNEHTAAVEQFVQQFNQGKDVDLPPGLVSRRRARHVLKVCAQLEAEANQAFDNEEARRQYLAANDLSTTSLDQVIVTTNRLLQSHCFYTVGVTEAHAWPIDIGTTAQRAAGKIHSDFEKGFISAEVIKPNDLLELGEAQARAQGKMSIQGKNYVVENGDVVVFRIQGQKGR